MCEGEGKFSPKGFFTYEKRARIEIYIIVMIIIIRYSEWVFLFSFHY